MDRQMILSMAWPEALVCPSWVMVDGVRRQCTRLRHGEADGSTCWAWHRADLPHGDSEAWTDEEEGREVRGSERQRRRAG